MHERRLAHVYGWLLLLPAAVLLAAFTHYPTLATVYHSLFTTGTRLRPRRSSAWTITARWAPTLSSGRS